MAKKRPRAEDEEGTEAPPRGPATIGQQTSHIKNKLVRAELYAKLKHKQKVHPTNFPPVVTYIHLQALIGVAISMGQQQQGATCQGSQYRPSTGWACLPPVLHTARL
jgi:hypothetical protein